MISIKCDLRTHTFFTAGCGSTLQENIDTANEAGIELLAVTDPFSALVVEEGDSAEPLPREASGVNLMYGCEADIVSPEGYLFGIGLPGKKGLQEDSDFTPDFIIAGISNKWKTLELSSAKATQMYINVICDDRVLMLGNLCRTDIEYDILEFIRVCRDLRKPIEIDEHSFYYGDAARHKIRNLLTKCAEENVMICADSGSMNAKEIGRLPQLQAELSKTGFPNDLIMNIDSNCFRDNFHKAGFANINTSWGIL